MGRPLNKRYFGNGTGSQIKVTFKLAGTEYDGRIVSQRSVNRFKVTDGTNTAVCKLVNKSKGALADGELCINLVTDTGDVVQATKLYNRTLVIEGNTIDRQRVKWNFASSLDDEAVQAVDTDVVAGGPIVIDTAPVDATIDLSDSTDPVATFTVVASGVADLVYQWQVAASATPTKFTNVKGATSAAFTTTARTIANNGDKYRVVVASAAGATAPVTSAAATLTVQA